MEVTFKGFKHLRRVPRSPSVIRSDLGVGYTIHCGRFQRSISSLVWCGLPGRRASSGWTGWR